MNMVMGELTCVLFYYLCSTRSRARSGKVKWYFSLGIRIELREVGEQNAPYFYWPWVQNQTTSLSPISSFCVADQQLYWVAPSYVKNIFAWFGWEWSDFWFPLLLCVTHVLCYLKFALLSETSVIYHYGEDKLICFCSFLILFKSTSTCHLQFLCVYAM